MSGVAPVHREGLQRRRRRFIREDVQTGFTAAIHWRKLDNFDGEPLPSTGLVNKTATAVIFFTLLARPRPA